MTLTDLVDILLDHCPWTKQFEVIGYPDLSKKEFLSLWLAWGLERQFVWWTPSPALIILRPINDELAQRVRDDYFGTIYEYDVRGPIALIDFCYAPGNYQWAYQVAVGTGKPFIAWEHRGRIHVHHIDKIPSLPIASL